MAYRSKARNAILKNGQPCQEAMFHEIAHDIYEASFHNFRNTATHVITCQET